MCNWLSIKLQKFNPVVRQPCSTLHWAVNDFGDIVSAVPTVRLPAAVSIFDTDERPTPDSNSSDESCVPFRHCGKLRSFTAVPSEISGVLPMQPHELVLSGGSRQERPD